MAAVLLYGATGYSGRLIAARAQERWSDDQLGLRLIVAGRTGQPLHRLAQRLDVEYRTFPLDDARAIDVGLHDVSLVINAAGPFALTAEPLAKAALRSKCHYVDIAGEVDVYKRLDDFDNLAQRNGVTMVGGAGHSAVASDMLLEAALRFLKKRPLEELGSVRIALSRIDQPSRGSVNTLLQTIREEVVVVRHDEGRKTPPERLSGPVLTYVPFGQLERVFDFGRGGSRRIATAVNLIDTLTARITLRRHVKRVLRIESYLETPDTVRAAQQWAALTAPYWGISLSRLIGQRLIDLLPDGPTPADRADQRVSVVVEVDDMTGYPLIDWRLETPNPYDFTACSAVAVAERIARIEDPQSYSGWRTPAEFLFDDRGLLDPCTDAPIEERVGGDAPMGHRCAIERRVTDIEAIA
jgi:saccharopine dehydrogenase (NAD+, L-lysine-forming)